MATSCTPIPLAFAQVYAPSSTMKRILSPIDSLRGEGCQVLCESDLVVMGKSRTFHCLLMEERMRVKKEAMLLGGQSPSVFGSPTVRDDSVAPVAPPTLGGVGDGEASPEQGSPVAQRPTLEDVGVQAGPETCDVHAATTDGGMDVHRFERVVAFQKAEEKRLWEEEEKLTAILEGRDLGILDYIGTMEQPFILENPRYHEEEERIQEMFNATAIVNERQFLREQRKVDKRTVRRAMRYNTVQSRIEEVMGQLAEHNIQTLSPHGSPVRVV